MKLAKQVNYPTPELVNRNPDPTSTLSPNSINFSSDPTKTDSSKTPGGNAPESRIVGFQQWRKKSLLPEVATRSPFFIKIDPI